MGMWLYAKTDTGFAVYRDTPHSKPIRNTEIYYLIIFICLPF